MTSRPFMLSQDDKKIKLVNWRSVSSTSCLHYTGTSENYCQQNDSHKPDKISHEHLHLENSITPPLIARELYISAADY